MKSQYSEIILENSETVGIAPEYPSAYDVYCAYDPVKVNDRFKFVYWVFYILPPRPFVPLQSRSMVRRAPLLSFPIAR